MSDIVLSLELGNTSRNRLIRMQQLVYFLQFSDERVSYHLFMDSLKPIELLICFSALVRWGESGGKRAMRKLQSESPAHFLFREMGTTSFRHRMKDLIPSLDLLRSSQAPLTSRSMLTHPSLCSGHMITSYAHLVPLFLFPLIHVIILDSLKIF